MKLISAAVLLFLSFWFPIHALESVLPAGSENKPSIREQLQSDAGVFLEKIITASTAENERTMEILKDYSFRENETEYETDKQGNKKIAGTRVSWYYYSHEFESMRSIPEMVDGVEVSEKEREKHIKIEEKNLKKRLAEKRRREQKEKEISDAGKEKDNKKGVQVQLGWVELSGEEILKLFDFGYEGEDFIDNVPVHLISFVKRNDIVIDDEDLSKQVPAVSGKIWITEQANIVKLEFHLNEKYKPNWMFGVRDLYMMVNYSRIDGQYWFPDDINAKIDAKLLKIKNFSYDGTMVRSDFTRFSVTVEEGRNR